MKYLLLALLLCGCGGVGNSKSSVNDFVLSDIPEITLHDGPNFNGTIDVLNSNSWLFANYTNPACIGRLNYSPCLKVDMAWGEDAKTDNEAVKLTYEIYFAEINVVDRPMRVIIQQDWVHIDPADKDGNHPISVIKLVRCGEVMCLAHYDNSWQFTHDYGDDRDENSVDIKHTTHPFVHDLAQSDGYVSFEPFNTYKIETITYNYGRFVFKVNGAVVVDKEYQTRSPTGKHYTQIGLYWGGYPKDNNPLNRIVLRIDNLKRYELK